MYKWAVPQPNMLINRSKENQMVSIVLEHDLVSVSQPWDSGGL
ncbi:hypothetical protein [Bacillus sp. X1(2014)]|nr:hypothetical protein [Bacillus sp. X1(2014)]